MNEITESCAHIVEQISKLWLIEIKAQLSWKPGWSAYVGRLQSSIITAARRQSVVDVFEWKGGMSQNVVKEHE